MLEAANGELSSSLEREQADGEALDVRHDEIENEYFEKSKNYRIEVTICEDYIDTDSYSEVLREEH
jgi:hypothetical protein